MRIPTPLLLSVCAAIAWAESLPEQAGRALASATKPAGPLASVAPETSGAVRRQPNPARPGSGRSNLHTAADGTAYLTWTEPDEKEGVSRLRMASLAPGAEAWSDARTITQGEALMENWADFPALARGSDGTLVAQWYQDNGSDGHHGHGYTGWHARSTDEGRTWSAPARLGHEFVSLASLGDGRVLTVWLQSIGAAREHREPGAPAMELRSRLLSATGETLGDWLVDPDVCTCCQTTLVTLDNNRAFAAYRGHTSDDIRDIKEAHFANGQWSTPVVVHDDQWRIAGCPVNGPAADRAGKTLGLAWFTAAGDTPRVLAKVSSDGGATYGAVARIDLGSPLGRVDVVALERGGCVVFWYENAGDQAALQARLVGASGSLSEPVTLSLVAPGRASGFPRASVSAGDRILVTWTEARQATTQVATAELDAALLRP